MLLNKFLTWKQLQQSVILGFTFLSIHAFHLYAHAENDTEKFFHLNNISSDTKSDFQPVNCLRTITQGHQHAHYFNIKISDTKKIVWFRVFKNASGTIWGVLDREIPDLKAKKPETLSREYKDYFKFAFVRNPWDRIVSCYFHKIVTKKSMEFKECFEKDFSFFVDYLSHIDMAHANAHIKLQTRLIPVKECNFIGRLDNFKEDFQFVCDALGIEMGELEHKHKTDHGHYSTYYTPRTKKIIARLYREDIETFGFRFEKK